MLTIGHWRAAIEETLGFPIRLSDDELRAIAEVRRDARDAAEYIKFLMFSALQ